MFETMFRSGVPPHIGQSPVPGSAADADGSTFKTQKIATAASVIVMTAVLVFLIVCIPLKKDEPVTFSVSTIMKSVAIRRQTEVYRTLLVRIHLQVVEVQFR